MKNFVLGLLLLTSVAVSEEYEFRDQHGFLQGTATLDDDRLVIRDKNGFTQGVIDSSGTYRDKYGFVKGSIDHYSFEDEDCE